MAFFALIGSNSTVSSDVVPITSLIEAGYIEMVENCPGYEYEAQSDGTWKITEDTEKYNNAMRDYRQEAILQVWPTHKQFEALTEAQMGRPEKMQLLHAKINEIKNYYPFR